MGAAAAIARARWRKDSSRAAAAGAAPFAVAWLGRILPTRRGERENDWGMDVPSAGMDFVPYVELRYNKKNTR